MISMTLGEIRSALMLPGEDDDATVITGVCRDSRSVRGGDLFIALPGQSRDGHEFIEAAYKNGAAAVLCSKKCACPIPAVMTDDTLSAVQSLAAYYKSKLRVKTVCVTGSVGKTTTNLMLHSILSTAYKTFRTEEDMNGQIGLPFAVFELDDSYGAAALEIGMNDYGQLSRLSRIAVPDIVLINNIGTAHIEFFETRENILKAKLEALDGISKDGVAVFNGDDSLLRSAVTGKRTVYFGFGAENDVKCRISRETEEGQYLVLDIGHGEFEAYLPAHGEHCALNAAGAAAAAREAGICEEGIVEGLSAFETCFGRQRIYKTLGITVIEDCYNASFESVRAALGVLGKAAARGKRTAVLGDMLEQGKNTANAHVKAGKEAAACADALYITGENAGYYEAGAKEAGMKSIFRFETKSKLAEALAERTRQGDAVLFKAARGVMLETAIKEFLDYYGVKNV